MSEVVQDLIVIAILIFVNSLLSMTEAALLSARKARLQQLANTGNASANAALHITENPNLFLSVIQIGITLTDVLTGAIGGATLAAFMSAQMAAIPALQPYSEPIGFAIVVMTITYFSIVVGELVPKRLGIKNPERIAVFSAAPMLFLSRVLSPVVRFLGASTDFVLRVLGVRQGNEPPVTEEELQVLLDQGTQAGVFQESEQDMVEAVFSLSDRRVYKLMTPRTEIEWLDIRDSAETLREKIAAASCSRFPVCQGSLDNVVGIVSARDLLIPSLAGQPIQLRDCLQPAYYIPETAFASGALQMFRETGRELVLVIDEFGSVSGLLTINDIMTEIVGDLATEEPQATQRQDGSWLLDGMLDIEEFKEIFHLDALPEEENYETLGGFIMSQLGRIPAAADQFEWGGLRFEVMDMDGRRVDKVLVTSLPAVKPAEG
ncbi:MAG: hemolysin family protein [Anaerolineales bacterium]